VGFSGYMSDLGDTSFTYSQTNGGEGFLLRITLNARANVDTSASQTKCGVPVPTPGVYAVCSN
jgi:hypothetical protein